MPRPPPLKGLSSQAAVPAESFKKHDFLRYLYKLYSALKYIISPESLNFIGQIYLYPNLRRKELRYTNVKRHRECERGRPTGGPEPCIGCDLHATATVTAVPGTKGPARGLHSEAWGPSTDARERHDSGRTDAPEARRPPPTSSQER